PMQRRPSLLIILCALVLGCACNRTEEPAAPSALDSATTGSPSVTGVAVAPAKAVPSAAAPATASASPPSACIVPLGEPAPIVGKAAQCPKDQTGNLKLPLGKITFSDAPGAPQVDVELARDEQSRERGLMYRTGMRESRGMLFSWDDER